MLQVYCWILHNVHCLTRRKTAYHAMTATLPAKSRYVKGAFSKQTKLKSTIIVL